MLSKTGEIIHAVNEKLQYDNAVKTILSDRQILAWILKSVVSEYKDMDIPDIIPLIDERHISSVPVDTGLTNTLIQGDNTESSIPGENVRRYDIRFLAHVPDFEEVNDITLRLDIEAQKTPYTNYDITTRSVYYGARMLSEQDSKVFTGDDYDKIQKVYSIWIIMGCPQKSSNTISWYGMQHRALHGEFKDNSRYDLINVIHIRLPKAGEEEKSYNKPLQIHRLFSKLFSGLEPDEKCRILSDDYGIKTSVDIKRGINTMCNLSDLIEERGIQKGIALEAVNTERERENTRRERENTRRERERADSYMAENVVLKEEVRRLREQLGME